MKKTFYLRKNTRLIFPMFIIYKLSQNLQTVHHLSPNSMTRCVGFT